MTARLQRILIHLACLVLGGLFIYASWHKMLDPATFAKMVNQYKLLPGQMVNITAIYLPPLEFVCGVALIFIPRLRTPAALLILAMLLLFTSAISINLARGISIACGCFSSDPASTKAGWVKVLENTGMIVLALGILLRGRLLCFVRAA